jgi:hypothetical protein
VAETIDLFVDASIFFNIGIGLRDISLRLVIVIITNKIMNSIFRKKFLKFTIQLGGKSFIMGKDKGGTVYLSDDISHGKGFSRTGYPE